jgi:tRNA(His) guanylyltransferase
VKFDELDAKMRVFETAHDYVVLPGIYMVARLDGRSFTKLTKETHHFETPFDERVRDMMLSTIEHLMNCGPRFVYAYTQSDEISLLFHRDDGSFNRKTRKLNSVLAGEASAKFSVLLGDVACFDSRISELATEGQVIDYFRWRNEDAHRNALSAHCYWLLRRQGQSERQASDRLLRLGTAEKNELLFQAGINFNDLPLWQKRGLGVWWRDEEKMGVNPKTGEQVPTTRRRLHRELDLPMRDAYDTFIKERLAEAGAG